MSDQQQRLRLAKRPDETKELGMQESGVVAESDWGSELHAVCVREMAGGWLIGSMSLTTARPWG